MNLVRDTTYLRHYSGCKIGPQSDTYFKVNTTAMDTIKSYYLTLSNNVKSFFIQCVFLFLMPTLHDMCANYSIRRFLNRQ